MITLAAAPVSGRERIHALDVVRGIAVFGILLMNITAFGMPLAAYQDPTVWGGATGVNLWTWITTDLLFEGTQRALFSLLFGAGFIVLTSRLEEKGRPDVADIYYRRSLWLLVFGLIHAYLLLWYGEVLYWYGMTGLMLYPLRKLSPKVMLSMAAVALIANATWSLGEWQAARHVYQKAQSAYTSGSELTPEQKADVAAWEERERKLKPDARMVQEDIKAHHGSYFDLVRYFAPITAHMESWEHYRLFFDVFSMMLIGMALFKLGVLTLKQPSRVYWGMLLIGYALGLTIKYSKQQIFMTGNFTALAYLQAGWLYDFARLPMAMGHLGALLLLCRSGWVPWLQRGLAAVGQMALTNYVGTSIICAIVFYGVGFSLYGQLERHQLYYVVVSIWVFQLIVSPIWLKHFRFGPLEWLWRWLTYLERPPMRRGSVGAVVVPS